jgi:acetoin utilization protein AcuB
MAKVDGILKDKNIHHLPVLADDKVVGIVSKSDYLSILHGFSLFSNKGKEKYNRALLESCLVQDVMTRNIATVKATDTLDYAMGFFRENLFHALPVVNEEKHLVGIITTYDLLSYAYS